jgi:hypothetical protein
VQAGLTATEQLWPAIQQAYAWVHQAAHLLANAEQHEVDTLKRDYQQLLATMEQQQDLLGALAPAVAHFQKVMVRAMRQKGAPLRMKVIYSKTFRRNALTSEHFLTPRVSTCPEE